MIFLFFFPNRTSACLASPAPPPTQPRSLSLSRTAVCSVHAYWADPQFSTQMQAGFIFLTAFATAIFVCEDNDFPLLLSPARITLSPYRWSKRRF